MGTGQSVEFVAQRGLALVAIIEGRANPRPHWWEWPQPARARSCSIPWPRHASTETSAQTHESRSWSAGTTRSPFSARAWPICRLARIWPAAGPPTSSSNPTAASALRVRTSGACAFALAGCTTATTAPTPSPLESSSSPDRAGIVSATHGAHVRALHLNRNRSAYGPLTALTSSLARNDQDSRRYPGAPC